MAKSSAKNDRAPSLLAENRRARFDYEILETHEAGIELKGYEVKSVRGGHLALTGSYALVRGGEAWLLNAQIPPYQTNNTPAEYEPTHTRRLLLSREQIGALEGKLHQKSISLVPLKAYLSHGLIKLELAVARARKKGDKREYLKEKETRREMRTSA